MSNNANYQTGYWENYQKIGFRFVFLYFILQVVPLDWKYYSHLFDINWFHLQFNDIFYISRYTPQFLSNSSSATGWGLNTLADWAVIAILAILGAAIWGFADPKRNNYNNLYYWLRVLLRYRLAIGVIAYGFIKFYPLQAPYPSISNLNTAYGDFNRWKLFALSLGIVPGYESFLGLVEIVAGLLLLFRKTATFGAFIILFFTGNVFMSNLAYEGGEAIYSLYLIVIALFIISFDAGRLYTLLALRKPTAANQLKPVFTEAWQSRARLALKAVFIFFFVFLYGYQTYAAYHQGVYHYPQAKGLSQASGLYDVKEFKVNGQVHPYSDTDPIRWQDVVFEKWATISIRSNTKQTLDSTSAEEVYINDQDRDFELAGSGGRSYYSYTIDTAEKVLELHNKNKHYPADRLTLKYTRPDSATIILSGISNSKDSVYAVLGKINKKYLLKEAAKGRNKGIKL